MSADADAQEAHIGRTAIEEMFQLWQVDEERAEWMEDEEGLGFDWWPGDFTVQVRTSGPVANYDENEPDYRLSVRTALLKNVDNSSPKFFEVSVG